MADRGEDDPATLCECGLDLEPPLGAKWWRPDLDVDPGPRVRAVVRYGESATLRRAVRRPDGSGWSEYGSLVKGYHDITPPMPWEQVGECWAGRHHPVVACEPRPLCDVSRPLARAFDLIRSVGL